MLVVDDKTMVLGGVAILLALLSPIVNALILKLKVEKSDIGDADAEETLSDSDISTTSSDNDSSSNEGSSSSDNDSSSSNEGSSLPVSDVSLPGISVVMTVDDEGEDLKKNLPQWLDQSYGGKYQVIVVVSGNDPQVESILKRYSGSPSLYTTFIPSSSRYMSRKKLAVTIGVKAARYDWVLLTDVDCYPEKSTFLDSISRKSLSGDCQGDCQMVLGYSNFSSDAPSARLFDNTYSLYRQLALSQRGRTAGYSGKVVLFRKAMFIEGKGYDGNLKYARGEYEFLANKFSTESNTLVFASPDAMVIEDNLSHKGWTNKCLNYLAIRKTLRNSRLPRFTFNLGVVSMLSANILLSALIAYSVIARLWILCGCAVFALLLSFVLRTVVLSIRLRPYLHGMSFVKLWWLEQTLPFRNCMRLLKYRFADKYDFISHKL